MTTPKDLRLLADFVLDVLRYDEMEQVSNIRKMLNSTGSVGWRRNWPEDFSDRDIVQALKELYERQLVKILELDAGAGLTRESVSPDPAEVSWLTYWFALTDLGREYLDAWTPPDRVGYDELQ